MARLGRTPRVQLRRPPRTGPLRLRPAWVLIIDDLIGGLWFIYNGDANGAPDADGRVLLAQLTTDGDIGGTLNVQYFPAGGDATTAILSLDSPCDFGSTDDCTYPASDIVDCNGDCINDVDGDQVCDEVDMHWMSPDCSPCAFDRLELPRRDDRRHRGGQFM